jgi:hypothetical protein
MKSRYFIFTLIHLTFSLQICAQIDWTPYSYNPVSDSLFDPNAVKISRPSVVFDDNTYHMWYSRAESEGPENMGYATSPDGKSWTFVEAPVLTTYPEPTRFDSYHACEGWVIEDGLTLKMWYRGDGLNMANIGFAWSLDGLLWYKEDGPGIDGSVYDYLMDVSKAFAVTSPCVMKDEGTYHMWYTRIVAPPHISRIGYATSTDGLEWNKVHGSGMGGAVLDWGNLGSFDEASVSWPAVIKTETGFMMWYAGLDRELTPTLRLGCATSPDGKTWTKVEGNGTKGACFDEAHFVSVIEKEGFYQMWYGIDSQKSVNYATSGNTAVNQNHPVLPIQFKLEQNYPNPFNTTTQLTFILEKSQAVSLQILNTQGRILETLFEGFINQGRHQFSFNAHHLTSGVYICHLQCNNTKGKKIKMLLIK